MKSAASQPQVPRLYYRVREVATLTGLGLRTVYAQVYSGSIPSRKIGNSRLIPASWLAAGASDADRIRTALAAPAASKTPKNRYTLGSAPRDPRGASHQPRARRLAPVASLTLLQLNAIMHVLYSAA
jgi:excisionase family DNA binding protein